MKAKNMQRGAEYQMSKESIQKKSLSAPEPEEIDVIEFDTTVTQKGDENRVEIETLGFKDPTHKEFPISKLNNKVQSIYDK